VVKFKVAIESILTKWNIADYFCLTRVKLQLDFFKLGVLGSMHVVLEFLKENQAFYVYMPGFLPTLHTLTR
jgi:hypothetical protein